MRGRIPQFDWLAGYKYDEPRTRKKSKITRTPRKNVKINVNKICENRRNLRTGFSSAVVMIAVDIAFGVNMLYKSGQFAARRQGAAVPRRR
jgi:hypothetical protein